MFTITVGAQTLEIVPDEHPDSPREWDHLGTMVCWHRRYELGDRHDYADPRAFTAAVNGGNAVILPLYLFDHSGLTISTDAAVFRAFDSAGWDWGLVGFIFATRADVRREFGVRRLTRAHLTRALDTLRAEVATYDQFLRGEVYGFVLKDNTTGAVLDACSGFFGDPLESGMLDHLPAEVAAALLDERRCA